MTFIAMGRRERKSPLSKPVYFKGIVPCAHGIGGLPTSLSTPHDLALQLSWHQGVKEITRDTKPDWVRGVNTKNLRCANTSFA